MPGSLHRARRIDRVLAVASAACLAAIGLAGCGGGSPLGNPPVIDNPSGVTGQKLSFVYFQKCINPMFDAPLPITVNGVTSINSCAGSGCHDNTNGTGGALRVIASAVEVDLTDPANTPDVIRTTDMYRNYYSALGVTIPSSPAQSRLLTKPQVQGVLHGGGLIFNDPADPNVLRMQNWINRPAPPGQDEFSLVVANTMFTATGTCNPP